MKQTITSIFLLFTVLFVAGLYPAHAGDQAANTPLAVPVEPEFVFKPVMEGQEVVHDFVIKNDGKALLEIKNVKPG